MNTSGKAALTSSGSVSKEEPAKDEKTEKPDDSQSAKDSASSKKQDDSKDSNIDFKSVFKNDAFMGDSMTEGLSFYEFLDEANVFGKKGIDIVTAQNQVDRLDRLKPKNIYLLYGNNDMDNTRPSKWFIDKYAELIHKIKRKFPNANVYVQSIMPVQHKVEEREHIVTNDYIKECNHGLMKLAKQENVNYLNIASLINENNQNLYEEDGEHFKAEFYPIWLKYVRESSKK
jgi:hypothetical protein